MISRCKSAFVGLSAALLLGGCGADQPGTTGVVAPAAVTGPPNIVILFADDMGYGDLGAYGHPSIRTPNLDAMAREGQRWTDFYVAAPVCSPSRAALLTGRLPNRTGLYGKRLRVLFPKDSIGIPAEEVTLAEALGAQGYRSAIVGKWHLGDSPAAHPTRHGFDYWYGLPYSNDMDWTDGLDFDQLLALSVSGRNEELTRLIARRQQRLLDPRLEYWNVPLLRSRRTAAGYTDEVVEQPADQTTLTRRYTEEAVAFIRQPHDAPFLLYLSYNMPHVPLFRSSDFVGTSRGGYYGDVIEEIDWSAGRIRTALEQAGIANNTLVLFTSDNGPWLTMRHHGGSAGHLNNGKGTTFEGGMRVPAIFWWPGTVAPATVSDIGSTLDVFATALSLAGLEPAAASDGEDLSGVLRDGATGPRQTMPYYRSGELQAFRAGPYKIHLVTEGAYGLPPERTVHETPALYHLGRDPGERFDIASEYPEVVADLLHAVEAHRAGLETRPPLFDQRLIRGRPVADDG